MRRKNIKIQKQKKQRKVSKKERVVEHLLRQEITYFKGLSFFLIVLIFVAMTAYGLLFGAMYLETKLTRLQMQVLISELSEVSKTSELSITELNKIPENVKDNINIVKDLAGYSFFENEILSFNFPKAWTYVDVLNSFKNIYFFTDGEVRDFAKIQKNDGDFVISLVTDSSFSGEAEVVDLNNVDKVLFYKDNNKVKGESFVYILPNKTLDKFLKLEFFVDKVDKEVMGNILGSVFLK